MYEDDHYANRFLILGATVVSTNQNVALQVIRRGLTMFEELNRSYIQYYNYIS